MRKLPTHLEDPIYQFADDITNSTTADNILSITTNLTDNFNRIKTFCQERHLTINSSKTQCILLKLPTRKIDQNITLLLDNYQIEFSKTVQLLGFTIDQHLSFKNHIEKTVKRCHGILGVIKKARPFLSIDLLKLCYTAIVRPHLEYCSLVFANASKTNLSKLETLQKIASRVICGEPRDAHADPLLLRLGLQKIKDRRESKVEKQVRKIINNNCHPLLANLFTEGSDGLIHNNDLSRTTFGKKRFSIYAVDIFNKLYETTD